MVQVHAGVPMSVAANSFTTKFIYRITVKNKLKEYSRAIYKRLTTMKTGDRVLVIDKSLPYYGYYGTVYAITSTGTVVVEFDDHSKTELFKRQLRVV